MIELMTASGVGTPVPRSPRHRPGRAVFPHPVPRSYSLSREREVLRKHQFVKAMVFGTGWGQVWNRMGSGRDLFLPAHERMGSGLDLCLSQE